MSLRESGRPYARLRRRAERLLEQGEAPAPWEADRDALVKELQLHELELELQNEELRQVQMALEQARDDFCALFERAPVPYLIVDRACAVLLANRAAIRLLGADRRRLSSFLSAGAVNQFHRFWSRVFESGKLETSALTLELGSGPAVACRLHAVRQLLAGASGGAPCAAVMLVVEPALTRPGASAAPGAWWDCERDDPEDSLLAALSTTPDAVVVAGDHGRIRWINHAAESMLGYAAEELRGRCLRVLLPAAYRDLLADGARAQQRSGEAQLDRGGREVRAVRRDGAEFPCQLWSSVTQREQGRVFCAILRDLTLSKRLEESLHQAQRMEAFGTLASGVAHDFNNLLTGLSGCANLALDALEPDHPGRLHLEEIRRSVAGGARTVRQLIDYSRHSHEGPGLPRAIDINDVVTHCQGLIAPMLGAGIDLVLDLAPEDTRAVAEPGQVEQILYNLVSNARDAMPDGGQLTIATSRPPAEQLAEGRSTPGPYVGLTVTDTGAGMDAAVRERIFEPFFTTKPEHKGSGLGLFSCRGLLQRWGGRIEVQSEPGRGSRFEVVLHSAKLEEGARVESARLPAPQPAPGGTVLLVEDDRLVRLTTRYFLEQAGYEVVEARRGDEAVELARSRAPVHVVLTDVTLPGLSGRWVAQETQAIQEACAVLYMSAHPRDVLLEEGRIPTDAPLLLKPFSKEELLAQIGAVLNP